MVLINPANHIKFAFVQPSFCGKVYTPVFTPIYNSTRLSYMLDKAENALVFQVFEQSADITAFLKKNNFMASNGIRIASDQYPELKHSKNVVFLRGTNFSENFKMDTTRFPSNMERDNVAAMVTQALDEFVKVVKNSSNPYFGAPAFASSTKRKNAFAESKIVVING